MAEVVWRSAEVGVAAEIAATHTAEVGGRVGMEVGDRSGSGGSGSGG